MRRRASHSAVEEGGETQGEPVEVVIKISWSSKYAVTDSVISQGTGSQV